jgi:quercetin dioxygenase-like cupin family protein
MAIPHALPAQPVDVRPLGARLADARTTALFKSTHLEVLRLVLPQGKAFPTHQVAGDITIHCLEGRLDVTLAEGSQVLAAGELLYLPGGAPHGVVALEDTSALVTIALLQG